MPPTTTAATVERTIADALPQFGVDPSKITREASFDELDVDSLDIAELAQIIEDAHGVRIKGREVADIRTVGDVIDLVTSQAR